MITSANANVGQFSFFFTGKFICEEAGIKTITFPQICCHTMLQNVNVLLYNFTFMLVRIIH